MIEKELKYFADPQSGGLDADSSIFAVNPNGWVNAVNFRTGSTDAGVTEVGESIGSTRLISQPQPSITFMQLGSVEDTENGRALTFFKDLHGNNDKIECYYSKDETIYTVLRGVDVEGGLNFSKDFPIHSAKIVNGLLIWSDSTNNEPRQISINAGIKAYDPSFDTNEQPFIFPLDFSEITLIKHPPALAPNIQKLNDVGFVGNFISNESFEFAFQYIWFGNETTVVGTYSSNSRLNKNTDNYNYIKVQMDNTEIVPNRVRIVQLIVRYSNTNSARVIKTWDRKIPSQLTEIDNQNAGIPLSFNFYNNIVGEALAVDEVLRPFDNVPIYSETTEVAKSRLFLGNNTEGYNTPITTSLTASLITTPLSSGGTSIVKNLISIKQRRFTGLTPVAPQNWSYVGWYVYITEFVPVGFYLVNGTDVTLLGNGSYAPLPSAPSSVSTAGLTFQGATLNDVLAATVPPTYEPRTRYDYAATTTPITITGTSITTYDIFKSRAAYRYGIVFYDYAMRKCGVATRSDMQISIPTRDFDFSSGINGIIWQLSNTNALNEIPDWAYYYTPVRTLNQLTRFFVDSVTNAAKYAQKNTDGTYTFTSNTFVQGAIGIGLNTTALYQSGLGYVYNEGDICILTRDDDTQYELPVIGQDGNYIIVKTEDIGTLDGVFFVYEIYTPYKTSEQEPFYEVGEMYRVVNPTREDREYEILSDVFYPDTYVISRNYTTITYFGEAMCPNDAYYKRWDNDSGKPNLITQLGQVKKTQYISWSDTFIANTAINGLSTFRSQNQTAVPEDCGAITKLILTSKVQMEGTVMLSICSVETNSMYLGETQITDSTGATQFFSQSSNVIGTINTLKGNYGCVDATSVASYRGNVYWLDAKNGRIIQYSANGLDCISDYKMIRNWKYWSEKYLSMTKAEIESFGDRPFVFAIVDPAHNELLFSIPKLSDNPPKGFLPDYPSVIYPFDILDFQGKTMVYKLGDAGVLPHWQGAFSFTTEGFFTLLNELYSYKNGNLYQHNQTTSQNTFYGVYSRTKLMFVSNMVGLS